MRRRLSYAKITATLTLVLSTGGGALHATVALAGKPAFVSLSVKPRVFQAGGGAFTISARVRNAHSCTLYARPLSPIRTVGCSSGRVSMRGHAPPNRGTGPALWPITLEAHNGRQSTQSWDAVVEVLPNSPPAIATPPPVKYLNVCAPSPECDYRYAYESFQNWGNAAPNTLGDCTFAAVANWEQIVLGIHADPTVIGYEFAQAGGTERKGLAQTAVWRYWQRYGIAGVYLKGLSSFTTRVVDVQNGVRDYGAMIAELSFTENDGFAYYTVSVGLHDVVVDGFTPTGPLVVSWGETLQMTWQQWSYEVVGMWGIGAS